MGFFSSLFGGGKDIHSVDISTSPFVEETPKNYFVSNLISSIREGGDTAFTIYRAYTSGPSSSLRRYMRYAQNKYIYAMPTVSSSFSFLDLESLESALQDVEADNVPEGEIPQISIVDAFFGPMTEDINAVIYCYKNYGLNLVDLTLSSGGFTWEFSGTENGGTTAVFRKQSVIVDYEYGNNYVYYDYYRVGVAAPPSGNWYVAIYYEANSPGTIKYFEYQVNSQPDYILNSDDTADVDETVTPVAPFRENFNFVSGSVYDSVSTLMDTMTVDIGDLIEALQGQNDLGKISNAFYVFGPNLWDNNREILIYCKEFFNSVYNASIGLDRVDSKAAFEAGLENGNTQPQNTYKIEEQKYNIEIKYNYITKSIKSGSIGKKGTIVAVRYVNDSDSYTVNNYYSGDEWGQQVVTTPAIKSTIAYREQVSDSTYEEVFVHGLVMVVTLPQVGGGSQVKYIYMKDQKNFLLPLIPDILFDRLSIIEQEDVIYRSMQIVAYAAVVEHLSWWESFVSSFLGQLIITIVSAYFLGPVGGGSWYTAGGQFLTQQFIRQVAISFVIGQVISKVLAPVLGDSPLLYAIAAVGASYLGSLAMDPAKGALSFADYLLDNVWSLATKFVNGLTLQVQNDIVGIHKELEDMMDQLRDKEQEIADAKDMLDTSLIDPSYLATKPRDRYYKNSNDFFKNCLKTNLASDMKSAVTSYKKVSTDAWSTVPQFI